MKKYLLLVGLLVSSMAFSQSESVFVYFDSDKYALSRNTLSILDSLTDSLDLADRIEFCWIHLRGIGSLENSLWGYDGQSMRVWLNALTIEAPSESVSESRSGHVRESVNVPLDFYPLCKFTSSTLPMPRMSDSVLMQLSSWTRV